VFWETMALGSFSSGAVYEVSLDDVDRMLGLSETLFVEHKLGIREEDSFKLIQAMAAFANTAGGWVLLGVENGKVVANGNCLWARPDGQPLVDMVRDRLRGMIDPLPAFEAKVFADHPAGPVGVVRIYESSDTPHILLQNGAVYVREVAGVRDATDPKRSGAGARADRHYKAVKIGSRAELLQLTARGHAAEERVHGLLNTAYLSPLVERLGLQFHTQQNGLRPHAADHGLVHVRVAPYTLSPRFRGWATTLDAAGAVLEAAENLAGTHGLASNWLTPDPAGVSIEVPHSHPPHSDNFHPTQALARVLVDGAGIAGAALRLELPDPNRPLPRRFQVDEIASELALPVIRAAAAVLTAGEFIGRSRCQIDLVGMQHVVLIESQGDHQEIAGWVPTTVDIALTASDEELMSVAQSAARALARSARLPFYDS
jgi:hypothetical protein